MPSEDSSPELQVAALRRLEAENQEAARQLEETVAKGEALLEKIQSILSDIAHSQLKAQRMQHLKSIGQITSTATQGPQTSSTAVDEEALR